MVAEAASTIGHIYENYCFKTPEKIKSSSLVGNQIILACQVFSDLVIVGIDYLSTGCQFLQLPSPETLGMVFQHICQAV